MNKSVNINSGISGNYAYKNGLDESIELKAKSFIAFIWLSAFLLSAVLLFWKHTLSTRYSKNTDINNYNGNLAGLFSVSELNKRTFEESEVFLFVKMNRKLILTRYPSNQQPLVETPFSEKNEFPQKSSLNISTTKVIKKIKQPEHLPNEDFSIKPVPK
ncbi:MAG: hypothetical protein ABI237_07275 [Ginsengibacter sp.]